MKIYGMNPTRLQETLHSLVSLCLLSDPGDRRFKAVGCRGTTSPSCFCSSLTKAGNEGSWVPPGHNICPNKTNDLSPKQADSEGQAREGKSKQIPLQPLATCNDFMV